MSENKEIVFIATHVDYFNDIDKINQNKVQLTIYGVTEEKLPIRVRIDDFFPYFYIQLLNVEVDSLFLEKYLKNKLEKFGFIGLEKCYKKSIYGYQENDQLFYKLFFKSPSFLKSVKTLLMSDFTINKTKVSIKVFESNFPFVLRLMNDISLTGMGYVRIKNYEITRYNPFEVTISHTLLEILPLEGRYLKVPNFKIFSFDIECCSDNPTSFPNATKDPVIQIGNTIQRFGDNENYLKKVIFCLKETEAIPDADVRWFNDEHKMLEEWRKFLLDEDPDILLGYNIKGFDFPYLVNRAKELKIHNFSNLGRGDRLAKVAKRTQSSNSFGSIETIDVEIEGRMIFDLYHVMKRDYKLRSYSLNAVSSHFLGEQKEDVPYSSIYQLFRTNKHTRQRIAVYCLKDTYLPIRLFTKLNILTNYVELSRATGVPLDYFSTRGAAIKVLAQIYREAGKCGYLIPDMENFGSEETFEGAYVMDPKRGYYKDPIAVLDFSSLYPSIMITNNLCYTTLLSKSQVEKYSEEDVLKTPTGNYFIKKDKKIGIIPHILENLLKTRKETKKQMKDTKDPWLIKALDGRQLALKICANSLYGFTGAQAGQLPCIEISQSTTSIGREMISHTKRVIETTFCKEKGFSHDTEVIYGDTDSVMINFKETNMNKVFEMAVEISKYVTKSFDDASKAIQGKKAIEAQSFSINLEFEKVYCPYILMNKKRYAGLIYNNPNTYNRIDTKGIETVRRDNCLLVKNIIEECLNKIMYYKDIEGAANVVKTAVDNLYLGKVDLYDLIISKNYSKSEYKVKAAHVELAEKLRKRGKEVKLGDRIPYVIVAGDKKAKVYDKAEDPLFVLENNLPIDIDYYIEHQVCKPVKRLFEPIISNVDSLFSGKHLITPKRQNYTAGPLNNFLVKKVQCIGCSATGLIVCKNCQNEFPMHLQKLQNYYSEKALEFSKCWTECQRCIKSTINEVLCNNNGCPIFYKRIKVKKDLEEIEKKLEHLKTFDW